MKSRKKAVFFAIFFTLYGIYYAVMTAGAGEITWEKILYFLFILVLDVYCIRKAILIGRKPDNDPDNIEEQNRDDQCFHARYKSDSLLQNTEEEK